MNLDLSNFKRGSQISNCAILLLFFVFSVFGQKPTPAPVVEEDFTWWYITLGVLGTALAAVIIFWLRSRKAAADQVEKETKAAAQKKKGDDSVEMDKELEWLRKNQEIVDRKRKKKKPANAINLPKTSELFNNIQDKADEEEYVDFTPNEIPLPVFNFLKVKPADRFDALPLSNDEALLSAIEQTQDEDEEDEQVRDLAVRILAAFKNRNSIESLSQVALYDLSSSLRSKAIATLADFDHESVFEWILLACADPTREVRAAAARGLTRLSFDRAQAWARILQCGDEWRMKHAARAAIEGGFVERSYDRLVHRDEKYAYEAFVFLSFMVKAGETEQILHALKTHFDLRVRYALLHILKTVKDNNAFSVIYSLLEEPELKPEVRLQADKVLEEIGMVTV